MSPNLFYAFLIPAMREPGCPICRIRSESEQRYLDFLLNESVNDLTTRLQIIASLGYCPKHTWQMGQMEIEQYGDALGVSIIYEDLVQIAIQQLEAIIQQNQADHRNQVAAWIQHLLHWNHTGPQDPFKPLIRAKCRVCNIGDDTERSYLQWLLEGLSEPNPVLRENYRRSDGLCLTHFRQALVLTDPGIRTGIEFVSDTMMVSLKQMRHDLKEYAGKLSWTRRNEKMTENERLSWLRALRFFAGNEEKPVKTRESPSIQPEM